MHKLFKGQSIFFFNSFSLKSEELGWRWRRWQGLASAKAPHIDIKIRSGMFLIFFSHPINLMVRCNEKKFVDIFPHETNSTNFIFLFAWSGRGGPELFPLLSLPGPAGGEAQEEREDKHRVRGDASVKKVYKKGLNKKLLIFYLFEGMCIFFEFRFQSRFDCRLLPTR